MKFNPSGSLATNGGCNPAVELNGTIYKAFRTYPTRQEAKAFADCIQLALAQLFGDYMKQAESVLASAGFVPCEGEKETQQ